MKTLRKGLSYTTLICSTLLTPVASQAAEFTYEKHSSGKHFMVMQGRIEQNDHIKFEKFIQNAPEQTSKVIFLNSNGGSLEAALHIAMTLSNYKINTVVMGDCLSACSVIFASGSKKHIPYTDVGFGEGGNKVGVHTPYITINGENYSQQVGSGSWWQIYGILRGSGMSYQQVKDFLHYTYTTPSNSMTYITAKDASVFGWEN